MTLRDAVHESPRTPINWGAGLRGIGVAWILMSSGLWYHSTLPLVVAALLLRSLGLFL